MSDPLVAIIKLAAVQVRFGLVRFGLVAMEVSLLSIGQMVDRSDVENDKPAQPSIDAETVSLLVTKQTCGARAPQK
jgi:hypothetical protein